MAHETACGVGAGNTALARLKQLEHRFHGSWNVWRTKGIRYGASPGTWGLKNRITVNGKESGW